MLRIQKPTIITFLLILISSFSFSQRLDLTETRFFEDNIPDTRVDVNNLTGAKTTTDTNTLNQLIEQTSNSGGGTIYIEPHNGNSVFYLNQVALKSNIHLKISPSVTIVNLPVNVNSTVFNVGDTGFVENVAITSTAENSQDKASAFKARLEGGPTRAISLIALRYVRNFKVSGIDIIDDNTKFNNIVMNLSKSNDKTQIATKGTIQHIYSINNHVGYGAIQTQSAITTLFKNINCTGGTALRIETGSKSIGEDNIKTVDDLLAKGIRNTDGLCAVDLSPHRVDQGQVDVTNVSSIGSTYTAIISGGFKDRRNGVDNLGTFSDKSYIEITGSVAGNNAQIKGKDFLFYNCMTREELKLRAKDNPDAESTHGKSIAVVRHSADPNNGCSSTGSNPRGCYSPTIVFPSDSNIIGSFERTGRSKNFVYDGDKIGGSCTLSNSEFEYKNVNTFKLYPNPVTCILNITGAKSKIKIYSIIGKFIMENKANQTKIIQVDVSQLNKGVYFISDGEQTEKFIKI
ncbi:T9SS type A sorting domain-containing protein [uncultured Algibacter sp.]|uniref:T9SS type A sorting domain-containing protein n=1 Tax=uncultured Algibacter sp. TaxID=298659 RepID=UPI00321690B5